MGKIISIAICLFAIITGIAIWTTVEITQTTKEKAHQYIIAPQLTTDKEIKFHWDTNSGYAFIQSIVKPVNGSVAIDSKSLLVGEYAIIIAEGEEYVQKTRVVTTTDSDGNTHTRTETYWEWDRKYKLDYSVSAGIISFGGIEFDVVLFKSRFRKDTINVPSGWFSAKTRYTYYVIEFNKDYTSYANLASEVPQFNLSTQSIDSLLKDLSTRNNLWLILVWLLYLMALTALIVGTYKIIENRA